ncbi:MAG: hypothetical protein ABL973_13440 [Micropepsaceae bacterium]
MLTEIDRVLIATPDREETARRWKARLDASEVGRDRVSSLSATRTTLRAGSSDIEILEPDGVGLIADELKRRGRAHLFAAGAMSAGATGVAAHAQKNGAAVETSDGRHYITLTIEDAPIRFVVSPETKRERAGLLDFFYEATVLAQNQAAAVGQITNCFALNPASFTEITSEKFGYTGVLTLFEAGRLHRFEVITPTDMSKTMGRYYTRERASFYMAFAESAQMPAIEGSAAGKDITVDRPETRPASRTADQLWLHPAALGGMMLGVSRPTMAWRWSGKPERVTNIDG